MWSQPMGRFVSMGSAGKAQFTGCRNRYFSRNKPGVWSWSASDCLLAARGRNQAMRQGTLGSRMLSVTSTSL